MYLCTSAPTQPTTAAAANLTAGGCVLVLDGGTGVRIDITGSSKVDFTGSTFTKPPAGVYTHGYMHIDNIFYIKQQRIFNEAKEGLKTGDDDGIHCSTLSGTGTDAGQNSTCGASAITPGIWRSIMTDFDTGEAGIGTDLGGGGAFGVVGSTVLGSNGCKDRLLSQDILYICF